MVRLTTELEDKNDMKCNCKQLPDLFDIEDGPKGFAKNLNELAVGDWIKLMQCPECKQYWRVDEWDKYRTQFAIKLKTAESWEQIDTVPMQKAFLLESRGGTTQEECMWSNCPKNRVKGVAYCVDHLYETGARK